MQRPARYLAFMLGLLVATKAAPQDAGPTRAQAEALAQRGAATSNPADLIAGLRGLLNTGATLADDDPWNALDLLHRLKAINVKQGGAYAKDIALLQATPRGSSGGFSRFDLDLSPGAREAMRLTVVADEAAIVEVRLKRGSGAADIDLFVTDASGAFVIQDAGPQSGILGIAAYVEFLPETCLDILATLVNAGTDVAHVAVIAPPALDPRCER